MKLIPAIFILILLTSWLHGTSIFVINSYSQTLSKIDLETNVVNNTFAMLGLAPNHMAIMDTWGYIVNSGANSVQKIDLLTGSTESNIFIADSCNPYDIVIKDDFAYVTGLFTNKVYRVSLLTNQVTDNISVGIGPEGMCIAGDRLYVANTGNYPNYTPSTVSVIDLESFMVIATIPVEMNPQFLAYADGKVHVACTGNWFNITGKICIIDPETNTVFETLPIGGNLGNIWISAAHRAYISEAMNSGVYVYDTQTFSTLNSSTNPYIPGGSCLSGNTDYLAIVDSQWGQNGIVKLVNWNNQIVYEYTVGLSPTDIHFFSETTPISDEIGIPVVNICVYPNPFTSEVCIKATQDGNAMHSTVIKIFNIKGQLIKTLDHNESYWNGSDFSGIHCPNGIYLFSLEINQKNLYSGKITLLR